MLKNMKMMKRKIYIVALLIGITSLVSKVYAQQMPQTNLYTENIYNINPAYAGFNSSCLEAYVGHITQWVGIDGAPSTNYLDIHKGLGNKMGIGGGFILDKTSMISRFSGNASFSYRLRLGDNQNLRVGLSLGIYQVGINTSDAIVQDPSDEVIAGSRSGISFNNELGIIYNYKKFLIGLSVPQIFETTAKYDAGSTAAEFGIDRHFTAFIKYDWDISEKWTIEPSSMMKRVTNVSQFDGNLMGTYNNLISLGVGYRTDVGILARLKLQLKEMIVVGYAYEFGGSNISSYSSGSHEIMLGIKFCKEKKSQPKFDSAPVAVEEPIVEPEPIPEPEPVEELESIVESEPVVEPEPIVVPEPTPEPEMSDEQKDVFKNEVSYKLGQTTFSKETLAIIDEMITIMKLFPDVKLEIIGHSCDVGAEDVKMNVSQKRADNIRLYLKKNGIDESRIKSRGVSDSNPSVPNTTEENKSKNRRVQFILTE
jgi:type IX secretion system PorP/SprF family membrane protein